MHPLDQLEDEVKSVCVATTIDPQDKKRIQSLINNVENAYPDDSLPDEWIEFKEKLNTLLYGVRDRQTVKELRELHKTVASELSN